MCNEILVDGPAFWRRLERDIARARTRVYVQTLSFEGDDAGLGLTRALLACAAPDVRLLVDSFSRFWHSDRFIYLPQNLLRPSLRREVAATRGAVHQLRHAGVAVRFCNPVGRFLQRLPARDHRKVIVVDDVAYIGGINFSDHNFEWHDLMVRLPDAAIADGLAAEYEAAWEGRAATPHRRFGGTEVFLVDGRCNPQTLEPLLERIRGARRSVDVISPYLTFPFCDALRIAAARGTHVRILSPATNNRGFLRRYMQWESRRSGFDLRLYTGPMSHLKAMLIDDEALILGSSNFDWLTHRHQGEILAVFTDPALIARFREQVLVPDFEHSRLPDGEVNDWSGELARREVEWLARLAALACPVGSTA